MKYRVIMSSEYEVEAKNAKEARENAIREFRKGKGEWEITYVGREKPNGDETDVTEGEP